MGAIVNEEFLRRVDPNRLIRVERNFKAGILTQKEYEAAMGRARITLDDVKPILTNRITLEEFEERHGSGGAYWNEVEKLMLESDELWEFSAGDAFSSRSGVVIIRDEEVAGSFILGFG